MRSVFNSNKACRIIDTKSKLNFIATIDIDYYRPFINVLIEYNRV